MRNLRALWARLCGLFLSKQREQEIAAELESHLQMHIEDNLRLGMTPEQARRNAILKLGGVEQTKQAYRERRTLPLLEELLQDVRYALRQFRNSPGFTTVALLTLALGIGANTGIFTLLDAVLLKSLPVPRPEQLYLVKQGDRKAEMSRFSYPFYQRIQRQMPSSAAVAAMSWIGSFYVRSGTGPQERARGQLVSGNYFRTFETYPVIGRLLTPEDDSQLSGSAVAVISYGYWQRQFDSDPAIIGRKLEVNGVPFAIIGVAARGFFGARVGFEPDLWMPLTMQSDLRYHFHFSSSSPADPLKPWSPQENIAWLEFVMRVKDPAAMAQIKSVISRQYWQDLKLQGQSEGQIQHLRANVQDPFTLEPGQRGFAVLQQEFEQPLYLLMGMAAMVLLIACANIANLLLARAAARERATAVQLAIGASRVRLVRQMLTECLLLSSGGGVLGIAVAFWCTRVLPRWASQGATAIPLNLTPDARVLFFSAGIAIATGMLFGLAPAMQSARVSPMLVLKGSSRSVSGNSAAGRWSLRKTLVASQVALSLVLLVGAGMFTRTLQNYSKLDPGFDRDHLLSVSVDTNLVGYKAGEFLPLYQRLTDRIDTIPGVRSAGVASCALVDGCHDSSDIILTSKDGSKIRALAQQNTVSLDYFKTAGIHLLQGRAFQTTDNQTSPNVVIVNQTFARRFFKSGKAVGERFSFDESNPESFEIVGIAEDARVNDIRETAPPLMYFPMAQGPQDIDSIDVRTAADPQWVAAQVRQATTAVDSRLPIVEISTLTEQIRRNLTQERMIARLTTMFGMLALALACLGLYGVMSYTVERRTGEIGVRLALGSTRAAVLWLVLKETLLVVGAGAALGLVLSAFSMHLAAGFIFGLSPENPMTIGIATALLFLVSLAAGFLPARRASSINPMQALRTE